MKALKRKDSTNENPIWGNLHKDLNSGVYPEYWVMFDTTWLPNVYHDSFTIESFKEVNVENPFLFDDYELVEVEVKVKMP